jgi:hypothetical protein
MMKTVLKLLVATTVALALSAASAPKALASITLNGTIQPGTTVVIIEANNTNGPTGTLKFKFSAPTPGAYSINFCIGPKSNPCGSPTSYVVTVPGGQERLAVIAPGTLNNSVLVAGQGTNKAIPFTVTME